MFLSFLHIVHSLGSTCVFLKRNDTLCSIFDIIYIVVAVFVVVVVVTIVIRISTFCNNTIEY